MSTGLGLIFIGVAISYILGIKFLSSPRTARLGNLLAAAGMMIAILATIPMLRGINSPAIPHGQNLNYWLIGIGILLGLIGGAIGAYTVKMTAMPQMVAMFNGLGGGAAALVGILEYLTRYHAGLKITVPLAAAAFFPVTIGSISLSGSMIAFSKLQGYLERPVTYKGQHVVNGFILAVIVALWVYLLGFKDSAAIAWVLLAVSLVFGVLMVLPIGGADMPVVISLLNSFTGLAVAADGFVINNISMVVAGTLVGSSGTLLTLLMCKAMNRPITNVLFGAFGKVSEKAAAEAGTKTVRPIQPDETALILANAKQVVIVPGYGMAVAQAQHEVRELVENLIARGVEVQFAIHPVAGRMPGHMNVLLAEANVPYDFLKEMDEVNPNMDMVDVCLVIGANDVVNPAAKEDPSSPIYGMPIVEAYRARTVIVMKRSMATGFAGIDNSLFYKDNTRMLFGDAKATLKEVIAQLKAL